MGKYTYDEEKVFSFWLSLLIWHWFNWEMHVAQTNEFVDKRPLIKTSFECFKREFEKVEWIFNDRHPTSLFTEKYWDSQFHCGVVKINREGYILTAWGYYKALQLKKKKLSELRKVNPVPRYEYRVCD